MKEVTTFRFIEEITATNSAPMKFLCKGYGFEEYFVKYISAPAEFDCLIYELLGSAFAVYFGIPTPEVALVHAVEDSFNDELYRNRERFVPGVIAFGSKVVHNSDIIHEMDNVKTRPHFKRFVNPLDVVTIALMDLLIGNQDRTEENYNVLVQKGEGYRLFAIDHFYCFGGHEHLGSVSATLPINVNQTILKSMFCNCILRLSNPAEVLAKVEAFSYLCKDTLAITRLIERVFESIPEHWRISEGLKEKVSDFITDERRQIRIDSEVREYLGFHNIQ